MEPARLGCPILLGPHTHNFAERVAELLDEGAARLVMPADASALAAAVDDVLLHPSLAMTMTTVARQLAERTTGTAARLADEIANWLRPDTTQPAPEMEQEQISP